MSWDFKRDEDFLRHRQHIVNELQKVDQQVRDLLLADFIILYNSWNAPELLKALKDLGVDNGEAGSKES
jgi:hypothetical protein